MRILQRFRPSPALVVASIALLVALAGTSIAAVSVVLPKNSVGTPQLKGNAVTSGKIGPGQVKPSDLSASAKTSGPAGPAGLAGPKGDKGDKGDSATALWASVDPNGTLVRNKGAASAQKIATGTYQVVFNQDVTGCSYQVTPGGPTTSIYFREVSASQLPAVATGVRVTTTTGAGALLDAAFFLAVFC